MCSPNFHQPIFFQCNLPSTVLHTALTTSLVAVDHCEHQPGFRLEKDFWRYDNNNNNNNSFHILYSEEKTWGPPFIVGIWKWVRPGGWFVWKFIVITIMYIHQMDMEHPTVLYVLNCV